MKKIEFVLIALAIMCFCFCFVKTFNTFKKINNDIDSETYIDIGQKQYTKEYVVKYYKQVARYICYFIFFIDVDEYSW